MFLQRYPEWHRQEKVVLVQVTSPTSVEEKEQGRDKTAREIGELVNRINGTYGSLGYEPVRHFPQYLPKEQYFALLRMADLGLITSVRDGMNTTSLEFVACQTEKKSPLILSEFSGTAVELCDGATLINPWDLADTAAQINNALEMSDAEKATRHSKLYKHIQSNTVQMWTDNFISKVLLEFAWRYRGSRTPLLDQDRLLLRYHNAKRRLFMFDYDGTLTPIVSNPDAARPSEKLLRTLKALVADHRNVVWIISGRDQQFLEQWMGHIPDLGLSAEHGCFLRHPGSAEWEDLTQSEDMSWRAPTKEIFDDYGGKLRGSHLEIKKVALTWHYRGALDKSIVDQTVKECKAHLQETIVNDYDVEVMSGKMNLEVRPRFLNKGEIAKKLILAEGDHVGTDLGFVFCLGDDFTDEGKCSRFHRIQALTELTSPVDMFRSLKKSTLAKESMFSVSIGSDSKPTEASYHLEEPKDVVKAVMMLNGQSDDSNGIENGDVNGHEVNGHTD